MSDTEMPKFSARPLYSGGSSFCWYTPICSECGDLPVDRERSQSDIWSDHLVQVHGAPWITACAIVRDLIAVEAQRRLAEQP